MLEYGKELEKILSKVQSLATPDLIREEVEKSREQLKQILRRYPEVHSECTEAIRMATQVIRYDCTRSDYIQKVREILNVIT